MQKTVCITGASSGFGKCTAELFLKNNWKVIALARRIEPLNELKLLAGSEDQLLVHSLDVQNEKEVTTFFQSLPTSFKHIDVLFNNAGLSRGKDELIHANLDHWEEMINTNIKGFLYVAKAVLSIMKEQGSGYIINTGSVAGRNSYVGGNVYGATKAAVKMLSESMRLEAAAYGVRVGEIAPGAAETEFSMVRFDQKKETSDAVYKGFMPLNGHDIANTVWFLSNLPEHVCIQELVIMPTAQPNANVVYRK